MDELPGGLVPREWNFRDLGGLKTRGGGRTRAGFLFRSARPPGTGREEWRRLLSQNRIRSLIDLRTSGELDATAPLEEAPGSRRHALPLFETILPSWDNPADRSPGATAQRYFEMLQAGVPTITRIIELLVSDSPGGWLIHCAAGRDRTGIVTAALLSLVGVEPGEIAADYGKSQRAVSDGHSALPATIDGLFDLVDSNHGSTLQFFLANGVSWIQVRTLRETLVEE